jgi:hypothetical protein
VTKKQQRELDAIREMLDDLDGEILGLALEHGDLADALDPITDKLHAAMQRLEEMTQ